MTEATSLNFGPAWLRDSLSAGNSNNDSGGGGSWQGSSSKADGNNLAAQSSASSLSTMKLAEFRYGREEMLALFGSSSGHPGAAIMESITAAGLLGDRGPQPPINLMGAPSEEEHRAWQRGANSEQSLRLYNKKDSAYFGGSPGGARNEAVRGAVSGRGRGFVRGGGGGLPAMSGNSFFDRHRSLDDEDGGRFRGGSRAVNSGGWLERSGSGEENSNGTSPRKSYNRDDWRRPHVNEEEVGGWRGGPSGRRWNVAGNSGSWRDGIKSRWRDDDRSLKDGVGRPFGRQRSRQDSFSQHSSDLPEWAVDEDVVVVGGGGGGGGGRNSRGGRGSFDSAGKFKPSSPPLGKHLKSEESSNNIDVQTKNTSELHGKAEDDFEEEHEVDVGDLMHQKKVVEEDKPPLDDLMVDNLVASLVDDESVVAQSSGQDPPCHTDETQWVYLDPQGNRQGPFSNSEMLEWFNAGYFQPDLMLCRNIDHRFVSLAEMSKLFKRVPFAAEPWPSSAPPPLVSTEEHLQQLEAADALKRQTLMLQHHQALLQHQLIQQQFFVQPLHEQQHMLNKIMQLSILPPQKNSSAELLLPGERPPPILKPSETAVALQPSHLLNNLSTPVDNNITGEADAYDPIKSLLSQLKQSDGLLPEEEEEEEEENLSIGASGQRSIWDDQTMDANQLDEEQPTTTLQPDVWRNQENPSEPPVINLQEEHSSSAQDLSSNKQEERPETIVQSGKKDKKNKRSEERSRRQAKKASGLVERQQRNMDSVLTTQKYIPGMEGSVKPEEPLTADKEWQQQQQQEQQQHDALVKLQLEQQQLLKERAEAQRKHEDAFVQSASKLAPWAKKEQQQSVEDNHDTTVATSSMQGMSLTEIQKIEEEQSAKRRGEKLKGRMEEKTTTTTTTMMTTTTMTMMNWAATAANQEPIRSKPLSQIQAEEEAEERQRQERERRQRRERQKESKLGANSASSVWGSASSTLTWASKASAKASSGFWEDAATAANPLVSSGKQNKKHKGGGGGVVVVGGVNKSKTSKEDAKVAQIFRERKKPVNEFESWCSTALQDLHAQVDIPTFMAFLSDIESPYEVKDYVKNYIGEGKGPQRFAKEYLERRSKHKNSLKTAPNPEDDLLTPAVAINPNSLPNEEHGGGSSSIHPQGSRSKKKGKGSGGGKKMDASHLLGFSVASERVNAGDIEFPQ